MFTIIQSSKMIKSRLLKELNLLLTYLMVLMMKTICALLIIEKKDTVGKKVNVAYDKVAGAYWKIPYKEVTAHYPGTGDAFTSVVIGALIQGDSLPVAIGRAARFISVAIKTTYGYGTPSKEGVMFEKVLPELFKSIEDVEYILME